MRIALIAHDSRKELMAQFCTAYVRILSENEVCLSMRVGSVSRCCAGKPLAGGAPLSGHHHRNKGGFL